ncbi:small vasohibin-binding protein, partial [Clarias magur]
GNWRIWRKPTKHGANMQTPRKAGIKPLTLETLLTSGAVIMDATCRKDKSKPKETSVRGDRAKQKSAQQELKQRQRAE